MSTLFEIEQKGTKLAKHLSIGADEISLLRTARVLNAMRLKVEQLVREHGKAVGWTDDVATAEPLLQGMEHHLRCVLLDYPSLTRDAIRDHLEGALDQLFDALALLEC